MGRLVFKKIAIPIAGVALALSTPAIAQMPANDHAGTVSTGAAPIPAPAPGAGGGDNVIVAVVNGNAISEYDVDQRIALFSATSNTPVTAETRPQIRTQILRGMEDEVMELQEARKHNVSVTNGEVEKASREIAEHNHITPEQLLATITRTGVKVQTFTQYIAAQLIWQKLVLSRYGTGILSDDQQLKDANDRYLGDLRRDGVVEMR